MTRVTVDQVMGEKLSTFSGPVEFWDESGRLLGYFSPADDPSLYEGVDSPLSEEELDRRERETVWHTTAEVLARLKEIP